MSRWRHFSDKEAAGLKDDLMFKLDRARDYFGAPIVITSGYRTPEHNAQIGGVPNSAHVQGVAADLRRPADQEMAEKLAWALGSAGFKRVGRETKHFHVDVDREKPSPAWFIGESK